MKNQKSYPDQEMIELLQTLKDTPERPVARARQGRAAFLAEVQEVSKSPVSISPFQRLINRWTQPTPRLRLSTLTIAIILSFVFLSVSSSVYAARHALPDQTLYPFKLWLEDSRLALTTSSDKQIDLHLDYAQERLEEATAMQASHAGLSLDQIYSNFQHHVDEAGSLLAEHEHDEALSDRLDEILNEYDHLNAPEDGNASDSETEDSHQDDAQKDEEEIAPPTQDEFEDSPETESEQSDIEDQTDGEDQPGEDGEDQTDESESSDSESSDTESSQEKDSEDKSSQDEKEQEDQTAEETPEPEQSDEEKDNTDSESDGGDEDPEPSPEPEDDEEEN